MAQNEIKMVQKTFFQKESKMSTDSDKMWQLKWVLKREQMSIKGTRWDQNGPEMPVGVNIIREQNGKEMRVKWAKCDH